MPTLRFETESGYFITADAYGDPAHLPVLLLHGGGQTRHSWGDTARLLADAGWYALALDARGHGDSDWSPEHHYDLDYLASDLRAVIAQLNQKPALVGASMGGMTALIAEGERPAHTDSICTAIVLVDIAPRAEQKGIERIFAFMSGNQGGFASLDEAAEAVAAYLPHRPRPSDHSRLEKNLRLRNDPNGQPRYYWHWDPAMLALWRQTTTPDRQIHHEERLYRAARALTVPTLIVRGGISDVVSEKVMAEFLDAVPHVQSVSVAEAGHMVAGDSNHAFTRAVIDFLRREQANK
ncbi:alpha/beta hydrolase [Spirosoma taeanense]|uniref:Alpha/beta hydrolase n=1 Tax=Spirosoma taeanense TaxID=2735870 RepID=A0A6M5Y9W2_9BACT|nr:alpha/beta fold hydrolase [Spirosoma taeanense]QJW90156.1 alpha/beta hydrolase [Spirosoma taeanense]